jgi:phage/plasmid primase-like uncharacterized protein
MNQLSQLLTERGIKIRPDFSGDFIRDGSQWFKGQTIDGPDGSFQLAVFGDFSRGLSERWVSREKVSSAEQERINEAITKAARENRAERERHWALVALEVEKEWEGFSDLGTTPYTERKSFRGLYGCRVEPFARGARLIVPARDCQGKLWGYQRIYSEKLSQTGTDKIFREGARKEGCFHVLGNLDGAERVLVCEGISTAVAIFEALDRRWPVVSVFDAGNLVHVAKDLRAKLNDTPFIFCADNDQWPSRDGKIYHTGRVKADAAAAASGNASVVLPVFDASHLDKRPTDFDDLLHLQGARAVADQILNPKPPEQAVLAKPKITETTVAEGILKTYGEDLVRQDKSLFRYNGKYWEELESWEIDQLKNQINGACGNALDSKKVNSVFATFFRMVPHVPPGTNLFTPNPSCGNFLDGTLRLNRDPLSGVYALSFSEHKRTDYLTWVIPVEYRCDRAARNRRWERLLEDVLEGHADKDGMLRALKQMGGAMLVPTFPQLFFLHGASGSRKSTVALTLARLVAERNVSSVDPANMENFQIEGMIGKLVNLHTDIDDGAPLPRGFLKRFEDASPVQVNRKGKAVVRATLPQVHIYCANNLPPNFEGSGKAFRRRLTLLHFQRDLTNGSEDKVIKRYEELIWAEGYQGILNWCLEGLEDLVRAGGKFFTPRHSLETLEGWQEEHDPLAQFLEALAHKEVDGSAQYVMSPSATITRKNLWEAFNSWQDGEGRARAPWNAAKLANAMRKRGFCEKKIRGVRMWIGIGLTASEESDV